MSKLLSTALCLVLLFPSASWSALVTHEVVQPGPSTVRVDFEAKNFYVGYNTSDPNSEMRFGLGVKFSAPSSLVFGSGEFFSPTLRQGWTRAMPDVGPAHFAHDVWGLYMDYHHQRWALPWKGVKAMTSFFWVDPSEGGRMHEEKELVPYRWFEHLHRVRLESRSNTNWQPLPEAVAEQSYQALWDDGAKKWIVNLVFSGGSASAAVLQTTKNYFAQKLLPEDAPSFTWARVRTAGYYQRLVRRNDYTFLCMMKKGESLYPSLKRMPDSSTQPNVLNFRHELTELQLVVEAVFTYPDGKSPGYFNQSIPFGVFSESDPWGNYCDLQRDVLGQPIRSPESCPLPSALWNDHKRVTRQLAAGHMDDRGSRLVAESEWLWPGYKGDSLYGSSQPAAQQEPQAQAASGTMSLSGTGGIELGPCEVTAITPEGYRCIWEIDRSAGMLLSGSQAQVGQVVVVRGDYDPQTGIFAVSSEASLCEGDIAPLVLDPAKVLDPQGLDLTGFKVKTWSVIQPEQQMLLVPYLLGGQWRYVVRGTYDAEGDLLPS